MAEDDGELTPIPLTPGRARGLLTGWFVFQGAVSAAFWVGVPASLAAPDGNDDGGAGRAFLSLWFVAVAGMGLMLFCGGLRFSPYWPSDIAVTARAAHWLVAVTVGTYALVVLSIISGTIPFVIVGLRG